MTIKSNLKLNLSVWMLCDSPVLANLSSWPEAGQLTELIKLTHVFRLALVSCRHPLGIIVMPFLLICGILDERDNGYIEFKATERSLIRSSTEQNRRCVFRQKTINAESSTTCQQTEAENRSARKETGEEVKRRAHQKLCCGLSVLSRRCHWGRKWPGTTGDCRTPGRAGSCGQNQYQRDWTGLYRPGEHRHGFRRTAHQGGELQRDTQGPQLSVSRYPSLGFLKTN